MNEEQKNIETCLPESILAEVASVPTDPQFVSLVNESLDPLKQQAIQQAGSDAYKEVVESHQPYTFTSSVRQMRSNLILLLRRLWRFPFGSGTLRSLSDMWAHYITRLQGSETYGIPSRLDQLTDLPSAPLLVADRKISGVPEAVDGMSMARILGDASFRSTITKLYDDNQGWTYNSDILSLFPAIEEVRLSCKDTTRSIAVNISGMKVLEVPFLSGDYSAYKNGSNTPIIVAKGLGITHLSVPGHFNIITESGRTWQVSLAVNCSELLDIECGIQYADCNHANSANYEGFISGNAKLKKITFPDYIRHAFTGGNQWDFISNNPLLEEIDARKLASISWQWNMSYMFVKNCPSLKILRLGTLTTYGVGGRMFDEYCTNLIQLEIGEGTAISLNFSDWSPTLDSSNLQQFLQNFRSFIVLRLANRKTTTALTLTLSAAVYNAVTGANSGWASQHTLADLGITDNDLTDLETELGITSATIYATWLDTYTGANGIHWDINKAN